MATMVPQEELPAIVNVYNSEGRSGAYDYIRSKFGVKNPYFVLQRIEKSEEFTYDHINDKFIAEKLSSAESLFLSLDTLCQTSSIKPEHPVGAVSEKSEALEKLVQELISDRLLELSRYVTIDTVGKIIYVDTSSIRQNGYRLQTI